MKALRIGSLTIFFLVACLVGSPAVQAKTGANAGIMPQASADCTPGTGWRWVDGPEQPQAASQAQDALARAGVSAKVTAFGYGEMDLCDTYVARGVDLFISLAQDPQLEQFAQAEIEWKIQKAL